jgi:hypothetical protein
LRIGGTSTVVVIPCPLKRYLGGKGRSEPRMGVLLEDFNMIVQWMFPD